jgi:hypothetical protein
MPRLWTVVKIGAAVAVIGCATGTVPAAFGTPTPIGAEQAAVTAVIYQVGRNHHVSNKVMLAAFEACVAESNCRNPRGGDRDSAGTFQQRPSMGWGTCCEPHDPTSVTNVRYAARQFFVRAIANESCCATAGQLAQQVQRSAFPDRYDQAEGRARALLAAAKRKA